MIFVEPIVLAVTGLQTMVCLFSLFLFGASLNRHLKKKNPISQSLMISFLFFFIGSALNLFGILGKFAFSWVPNNPIETYFQFQIMDYQFSYYFLILGIYFLYIFSMHLTRTEFQFERKDRVLLLLGCLIILLGLIRPVYKDSITDEIMMILTGIDIYVVIFALVVLSPMIKESTRLLNRIEKTESSYNRIKFLVGLSYSLTATIIALVMESIVLFTVGELYNVFTFAAWILAIIALICAYYALYYKEKA
jgi:hypothetical protein